MIARSAKLGAVLGLPLFMVTIASMAQADTWVPVDQGWTQSDLKEWYEMSAGSRLIPLSWLLALEQPDNDNKFLDDAHVAKFRYLPHVNSGGLPLPLGFTVDTQSDKNLKATKLRWKASQGDMEPWVGMNCAACHTAELTYKGNRIRVQGAPTLADFQSFMAALDRALSATRDDPAKWDRFASRVLAGGDTQADRARLKDALDQFTARRLRIEAANVAPLRDGYGRLDAFGHIFNDIALSDGAQNPKPIPSDAPVSYPFLWNVPQHDKVQWDGIAPNKPLTLNGAKIDPGAPGPQLGRHAWRLHRRERHLVADNFWYLFVAEAHQYYRFRRQVAQSAAARLAERHLRRPRSRPSLKKDRKSSKRNVKDVMGLYRAPIWKRISTLQCFPSPGRVKMPEPIPAWPVTSTPPRRLLGRSGARSNFLFSIRSETQLRRAIWSTSWRWERL